MWFLSCGRFSLVDCRYEYECSGPISSDAKGPTTHFLPLKMFFLDCITLAPAMQGPDPDCSGPTLNFLENFPRASVGHISWFEFFLRSSWRG